MSEDFLRMKPPPIGEVLYNFAQEPTFPICVIEFEEEENLKNPVTKIKVNKEFYNRIIKEYGENKVILYCSIYKDLPLKFGTFSPTMEQSYSILKDLQLICNEREWVNKSQEDIKQYLKEDD